MPTFTTHYDLAKPLVNNATDQDLWGGYLNDDMDSIDSLIYTATNYITSAKSADYSVLPADSNTFFLYDTGTGAKTLTLPALSSITDGFTVAIKKCTADANVVNIVTADAVTIDDVLTYSLNAQESSILVTASTALSNWKIISGTPSFNNVALTGTPTAPTAAIGTNTTQIATTAFVQAAVPVAKNIPKAWVNFNGTTGAIRASGGAVGVASVTRNSAGNYTINFASTMTDANYSVALTTSGDAGSTTRINSTVYTSAAFGIFNFLTAGGGNVDSTIICAQVFGN